MQMSERVKDSHLWATTTLEAGDEILTQHLWVLVSGMHSTREGEDGSLRDAPRKRDQLKYLFFRMAILSLLSLFVERQRIYLHFESGLSHVKNETWLM